MEVNEEFLKGVTEFVKSAQETMKAQETELQKLAEAAPAAVDALIKAGAVDGSQREVAVKQLIDEPHRAVISLQKLAERMVRSAQAVKQGSLGTPAGSVNAPSATGLVTKVGEADRKFAAAFGFNEGV